MCEGCVEDCMGTPYSAVLLFVHHRGTTSRLQGVSPEAAFGLTSMSAAAIHCTCLMSTLGPIFWKDENRPHSFSNRRWCAGPISPVPGSYSETSMNGREV